jgi:transcriptional regulator with XRE-family HTH domain
MKNRLRHIRLSQKKTLKQAAEATGLSIVQVSRLEKDQREFTLEVLFDFCAFYKVSVDEIVDVPIAGKNKARYDEMLMDTVVGYLVEACDRMKVKADARQINKWATSIYNDAVNLRFNPKQVEGMAYALVAKPGSEKASKTAGKP